MTEHPAVVLLIDDQRFVGESVRQMLAADAGVAFHFCQDPARAIATANAVKPTVILQDLVMPGADGLELVVDELAVLFVDELECQKGVEAEFAAARAAEHDLSKSMHPPR